MRLFLFCLCLFMLFTVNSKNIFTSSDIEIYLHFRSTPDIREASDLAIEVIEKRLGQKPTKLADINWLGGKRYEFLY